MRQFLLPEGATPAPGERVALDPAESRHLVRVLRARPGDTVWLTDGAGHRCRARLETADPAAAALLVEAVAREAAELARPRLVLACGIVRDQRFTWALEKAVEVGAHAVVPLLTARGVVAPRGGKADRWRRHLAEAVKQSGRAWLPELAAPRTLADWLADAGDTTCVLFGLSRLRRSSDPGSGEPWWEARELPQRLAADPRARAAARWAWVVGPEGGWRDDEVALLRRHGRAVRLGPHRLRTETAAVAGLVWLAAARERLLAAGETGDEERASRGDGEAEP